LQQHFHPNNFDYAATYGIRQQLAAATLERLRFSKRGHEREREYHQNFDFPFLFDLDPTLNSLDLLSTFSSFTRDIELA